MVVLPLPGGPQRMKEDSFPELSICFRRESSERSLSWPIISSNVSGRHLSARGIRSSGIFSLSNKSICSLILNSCNGNHYILNSTGSRWCQLLYLGEFMSVVKKAKITD